VYSWSIVYAGMTLVFCLFLIWLISEEWSKQSRAIRRPSLKAGAVLSCLLIGMGMWLLMTWIDLSGYLGYPILRIWEGYPQNLVVGGAVFLIVGVFVPFCVTLYLFDAVWMAPSKTWVWFMGVGSVLYGAVYLSLVLKLWGIVSISLLMVVLTALRQRSGSWAATWLVAGLVHVLRVTVFLVNGVAPALTVGLPLGLPISAATGAVLLAVGGVGLWLSTRGIVEVDDRPPVSRKTQTIWILLSLVGLGLVVWDGWNDGKGMASWTPLTATQKEAEFRYLTQWVREDYAFRDVNVEIKGLNDLDAQAEEYIQRAAATADDEAYFDVVREYLTQLGHGVHMNLVDSERAELADSWAVSYVYGVYRELLSRASHWHYMEMSRWEYNWNAHSDLSILYQAGAYVLGAPAEIEGTTLPVGTRLESVNGVPVDDYVRQAQMHQRLHFDAALKKPYLFYYLDQALLLVAPGKGMRMWTVEFALPDGTRFTGKVEARSGMKQSWGAGIPNVNTESNVRLLELSPEVGYVRLFGFHFTEADKKNVQEFLAQNAGRYQTLILDVRDNDGGDPAQWMDYVVAPLLKEPLVYTETALVRRDWIERQHVRFWLFKLGEQHNGLLTAGMHFKSMAETAVPAGMDPAQWRTFQVTREIAPVGTGFNGKLYLLTNAGCFSACSDLALMVKTTGMGTIVGQPTGGGAAVLLAPQPLMLPESGILVEIEGDLVLNPDGTFNEAGGTAPDWVMPAEMPLVDYSKAAVLADPWVVKIVDSSK